ncbi:MAG: PIG-L deacetylase family protein [Candidatus Binatia bacterium]
MLELALPRDPQTALRILCLGAHSDDIEIGCGATVLRLVRQYPAASFCWVVFGADREHRKREAGAAATAFLAGAVTPQIRIESFRDGYFPFAGERLKQRFEEIKAAFQPDVIFTHSRDDLHQDHRVIGDTTWQTFRDTLILEYEIPKWDGDLRAPNCYVPVPADLADRKVELICEHFQSQRDKQWFTPETFRALMLLRGIESRTRFAEAFHARKLVLR